MNFQQIISDEVGRHLDACIGYREFVATSIIERLADEGYHITTIYVPNFILIGYFHQ